MPLGFNSKDSASDVAFPACTGRQVAVAWKRTGRKVEGRSFELDYPAFGAPPRSSASERVTQVQSAVWGLPHSGLTVEAMGERHQRGA